MAEITDYLQDLGEQKVQEEKKIEVVRNPIVDNFFELYEDIFDRFIQYEFDSQDDCWDCYEVCANRVGRISYCGRDISDFAVKLKDYEKKEYFRSSAGLFLAALVNRSDEEELTIFTSHLSKNIRHLGLRNEKRLTIIGNAGKFAGQEMSEEGILFIKGNAGSFLGRLSDGGEIHIDGNVKSISADCRAKVYHKGELGK